MTTAAECLRSLPRLSPVRVTVTSGGATYAPAEGVASVEDYRSLARPTISRQAPGDSYANSARRLSVRSCSITTGGQTQPTERRGGCASSQGSARPTARAPPQQEADAESALHENVWIFPTARLRHPNSSGGSIAAGVHRTCQTNKLRRRDSGRGR
jgi:hypothetical protein